MRISNDMFDECHNVRPGHRQKPIQSHDEGIAGLFDRYPWLMKACIAVGVLIVIGVSALGMRAVFNHDSGEPDVDQIIFENSRSRGHQINAPAPANNANTDSANASSR